MLHRFSLGNLNLVTNNIRRADTNIFFVNQLTIVSILLKTKRDICNALCTTDLNLNRYTTVLNKD